MGGSVAGVEAARLRSIPYIFGCWGRKPHLQKQKEAHRKTIHNANARRTPFSMAICGTGRTAPSLSPYKVIAFQPPTPTPNKNC
jgi:hypothetical protein